MAHHGSTGLTILLDRVQATIDIVAIHGIGMQPDEAWTATAGDQDSVNWLVDGTMLPKIVPDARIMRYDYESSWFGAEASHHRVTALSKRFLLALKRKRKTYPTRPIIFIAHCFGGLVIVKALLDAIDDKKSWPNIWESTVGIVFLGTPFRGADGINQHQMLEAACFGNPYNRMQKDSSKIYEIGNEFLQHLVDRFTTVNTSIDTRCFWELKSTTITPGSQQLPHTFVVSEASGCLDTTTNTGKYSLNRDHFNMTKFADASDEDFLTLGDIIAEMADKAHMMTFKKGLDIRLSFGADAGNGTSLEARSDAMQSYLQSLGSCNNCAENIMEASVQTLGWIWEDPDIATWLKDGTSQLWVTGKPGSGKSVMMKELFLTLQRRSSNTGENLITVCHFFNNCGKPTEKSFIGMLQCFLYQILEQAPDVLPLVAMELRISVSRQRNLDGTWSQRSLQAAMEKIISYGLNGRRLFLFTDGLDECDKTTNFLYNFFHDLLELRLATGGHIHVCCATRFLANDSIASQMRCIPMHERNASDIINYIAKEWAVEIADDEELADIRDQIISRADGVFLWVQIVLERLSQGLRDGNNVFELSESLQSIPGQLSDLYDTMLKGIRDDYTDEMLAILSIVLCASRPLTLLEFRYILALCNHSFHDQEAVENGNTFIKTDDILMRRLRSRCGGLADVCSPVETMTVSKVIEFMHQSVKDHLLSHDRVPGSKLPRPEDLFELGHRLLTIASLNYLMLQDLESVPSHLSSSLNLDHHEEVQELAEHYPLLEYCSNNWTHHYHESEHMGTPQWQALEKFCDLNASAWSTWCTVRNWQLHRQKVPDYHFFTIAGDINIEVMIEVMRETEPSVLEIAVQHDFLHFVRRQLEAGDTVNDEALMQLAAMKGHAEMVELLIEHGASLFPREGITPLVIACMMGHTKVAKKLLECGAARDPLELYQPIAVAAGLGNADMIELLYQHDPETFMNGATRHYALGQILIKNIMRMIFAYGGDMGELDEAHFDELSLSEKRQSTETAIGLLTTDGINSEHFGRTFPWLLWFLTAGRESIVEMLLERDVDFSVTGADGSTFFLIAAFASTGQALQTLFKHDPQLAFAVSAMHSTTLHAAAANADIRPLQFLLAEVPSLDINAQNDYQETPLHIAAKHGLDAHIAAVVNSGADVMLLDNMQRYPLHLAVGNSNITNIRGVFDSLCPSADMLDSRSHMGATPLHLAARFGTHIGVQWLIDAGANIEACDANGQTMLHAAAANEKDVSGTIIEILICNGHETIVTDDSDATPLHSVLMPDSLFPSSSTLLRPIFSEFDEAKALKMRDRFASLTTTTTTTATTISSSLGAQNRIRLLVSHGVNINSQDSGGSTLLHFACGGKSGMGVDLVRYLIEDCGADASIRDDRGCRPLDLARDDAVRAFLEARE